MSMRSSRSNNAPEVKKASGVEVKVLDEDQLPPARDSHEYQSRNLIAHDDDLSVCEAEVEEDTDMMNKTSQAYLEKIKAKLEKEMLHNQQMIEAEK